MEISEALHKYEEFKMLNRKKSTVRGQIQEIKRFCMYTRKDNIEDIDVDDIVAYLSALKKYNWAQNSLRDKACHLRVFFKHFRLRGETVINENLIELPRSEHRRPRVATAEEIQKLLAAIPTNRDPRHVRNRAMIMLLMDTAARNSEILSLNIEEIDLVNMRTIVNTKKNRGSKPFRELLWFEDANNALKAWIEKRDYLIKQRKFKLQEEGVLFPSLSGGMYASAAGKRMTPNGLSTILRSYSKRAGIETLNPHAWRHYGAREIRRNGADLGDVAELLGHTSPLSSMPYVQLYDDERANRLRGFVRARKLKNDGI